jgi:restriction endonuclease
MFAGGGYMKLHFEADLDYQLQAVEAVCDLFRGQEICRTEFTALDLLRTISALVTG